MALTNFAGAVAVITGGASGIGLATARGLHARGAHVVLADISRQGLQQAEEQIRQHDTEATGRMLSIPTDVTDEQQVQRVGKRAHNGLPALLNSVGNKNVGKVVAGQRRSHPDDDFHVDRPIQMCVAEQINQCRNKGERGARKAEEHEGDQRSLTAPARRSEF